MPDLSSYSGSESIAGATVKGNYNSQGILEITIVLPSGQTVGPDLAFSQAKARDIARNSSDADAQAITSIAASITDILPSIRNQIDTQATTGTPNTASPAPAADAGPAATPAPTQPDPPPQTSPNPEVVAELAEQSAVLQEDKANLQESLQTIDNELISKQIDLATALNDPNAEPAEIAAIQSDVTTLETARATGQFQLDQINQDIAVNDAALADPSLNSVPVGDPYVDPNYLPPNESFTSPAKNDAVLADLAEKSAVLQEDKANLESSLNTIDGELTTAKIKLENALDDPNAEPAEIAAIQNDIDTLETAKATGQVQLEQIDADIADNDAALADPSLSSIPEGDPYVDPNYLNPDYLPPGEQVFTENDAVLDELEEPPIEEEPAPPDIEELDNEERVAGLEGEEEETRAQATAQDLFNYNQLRDWRVVLELAPGADYLYAAESSGILLPIKFTGGVVFPYTPQITVQYAANYDSQEVTHSNYKINQYRSSSVEQVTITGDFTAQDTYEANYVLAVIHFFRSLTKMFYGQDIDNGTPPPLVYLSGFGEYQFNRHPLVVTGFTYQLPNDVDYIRASKMSAISTDIQSGFRTQSFNSSSQRVSSSGLGFGGEPLPPDWESENNYGGIVEQPTYVPTKIQLSITCLPIVSRRDISQRFSEYQYGTGELLLGSNFGPTGGGIW